MDDNMNRSSLENENDNVQDYSLNDDRRVRTLSPGRLVARRFFRNRVAVTGLVILIVMFVFSLRMYYTRRKSGISPVVSAFLLAQYTS